MGFPLHFFLNSWTVSREVCGQLCLCNYYNTRKFIQMSLEIVMYAVEFRDLEGKTQLILSILNFDYLTSVLQNCYP